MEIDFGKIEDWHIAIVLTVFTMFILFLLGWAIFVNPIIFLWILGIAVFGMVGFTIFVGFYEAITY